MDEPNPWTGRTKQVGIDLIKAWDWIRGKKRKKLREWLAYKRECRRQALHYKEPEVTKSELYDEMKKDG